MLAFAAMRTVIVSDVHSNIEGLLAVLAHAEAGGPVDALWCTGDIVGYGPDPSAVIAELRRRGAICVAGNHDRAACSLLGIEDFNPMAADAVIRNAAMMSDDEKEWLAALPLSDEQGHFTLVHGSLRAPEWEYLLEPEQAHAQFGLQRTRFSIVGHSHLTFWVEEGAWPKFQRARDGDVMELAERRLILNPGSAGQPRDGDPRAAYILYDDGAATMTWHRVEYDIASTQAKMRAAGLDRWLAERLSAGR